MSKPTKADYSNFWERTGLDWLPVLWNAKQYFPYAASPSKARIEQIEKQTGEIPEDAIDEVLVQFGKINEEVQRRWTYVEGKASTLLSFIGIGTTFAFGVSQFSFVSKDMILVAPLRIFVVAMYILITTSLFITITLVRKVISVAGASSPKPSDLLGLRGWNRLQIKQQHAANLLVAYEYNTSIVNNKVTYLMGVELWFGNTIFLLLVLLASIGVGLAVPSVQITVNSSVSNSVNPSIQQQTTIVSPTLAITQSLIPTNFVSATMIPAMMTQTLPAPIISPLVVLTNTTVVTP
jgi:hypothetical protein